MGETYFRELGLHFRSPVIREHFNQLARVERHAAAMVEPLLEKYGLRPRSAATLEKLGKKAVERHQDHTWNEFIAHILKRYPLYMDDFHGLENMAPVIDLPYLEALSDHELAAIEFAERERAGDKNSVDSLAIYLSRSIPASSKQSKRWKS